MTARLQLEGGAAIDLGEGFVEALAPLVAAEVAELMEPAEPWLDVEQAAAYLACPASRIYDLVSAYKSDSDAGLEYRRDGRRLLFRREWLDAVLERP
jgi:hypothetical protein